MIFIRSPDFFFFSDDILYVSQINLFYSIMFYTTQVKIKLTTFSNLFFLTLPHHYPSFKTRIHPPSCTRLKPFFFLSFWKIIFHKNFQFLCLYGSVLRVQNNFIIKKERRIHFERCGFFLSKRFPLFLFVKRLGRYNQAQQEFITIFFTFLKFVKFSTWVDWNIFWTTTKQYLKSKLFKTCVEKLISKIFT